MNIIQSVLLMFLFLFFFKTYASCSISFLNKNSKEVLLILRGGITHVRRFFWYI